LEAVNDLLTSFEVPVIFITAFPERFLTGERPEPAFLFQNPISNPQFRRSSARHCSSNAMRYSARNEQPADGSAGCGRR